MSYLLDNTLDYLPKVEIEEEVKPVFNINCSDDKDEKYFYNLSIDLDGSIVGNINFTRRDDLVFVRESQINEKFEYLVEEAFNSIRDLFDDCKIFNISSAKELLKKRSTES